MDALWRRPPTVCRPTSIARSHQHASTSASLRGGSGATSSRESRAVRMLSPRQDLRRSAREVSRAPRSMSGKTAQRSAHFRPNIECSRTDSASGLGAPDPTPGSSGRTAPGTQLPPEEPQPPAPHTARRLLHSIPALLVAFRCVVALALLLSAWCGHVGAGWVAAYVAAIVSDIFDGVIARRLGVSSERLRMADSSADCLLFGSLALSTWLAFPGVLAQYAAPLLSAVAAQVTLYVSCLVKFGKRPCYHTYLAKVWGIAMVSAVVALFGCGEPRLLGLMVAACWLNTLEEIAITLILPEWRYDVWSVWRAMEIRQAYMMAAAEGADR